MEAVGGSNAVFIQMLNLEIVGEDFVLTKLQNYKLWTSNPCPSDNSDYYVGLHHITFESYTSYN